MDTNILTNKFFQSLHCPKGANAFFALGLEGSGGFGNCTDYIPKQNIYIGITKGGKIKCLPFFSNDKKDWFRDYMISIDPTKADTVSTYSYDGLLVCQ